MAGIYIHIPFCKQACSYCDFHFSTSFENYRSQLLDSICTELKREKSYLAGQHIETIYFGGGTPSLLTSKELSQLLKTIRQNFSTDHVKEITLEANPDDISTEKLQSWKSEGINRLSIGLQSFKQEDLNWMNRAHTAEESQNAVKLAHDFGFNLTIDLIYGLPNSSLKKLEENVNIAIDLSPDHISAYCLTIEDKTLLKRWVEKGEIKPASEDEQADQFGLLLKLLQKNGYHQYEISNFAKKEAYSLHNSNYWKGVHYLGVGPSAHSFNGVSRRWNISNNNRYIKALNNHSSYYETEVLSKKDQFNEYIMTGLRTAWGVEYDRLEQFNKLDTAFLNSVESFKNKGFLTSESGKIKLTDLGKLQADHIAASLFI